ncbi:MAG: lipopolysaccharide assembly protein LapB [Gammaproteobacteria bacterium]|jgi:lipopolysaccharide biosynthesis regulator YciM|nr:lipopolysaccharide assembly protein LapB [Gammaproteobacteria bacterium]|tara:strand:+ start:6604 stop:7770 length:1167 start_codon:yes stop_codon:yes gene_type:complete
METWLLYFLIVAAIGCGWWLGRREKRKGTDAVGSKYYQGLNFLLNEEPDRAVATFIDDLEVNPDTLETHLALGGLLRRRGELDKAVVVHENILNRATLDKESMQHVQLELARDYLLAGLLDRAEELSVELEGASPSVKNDSYKITLEIYEREREWAQAIEVAKLLAVGDRTEKYEKAISHYYCEIAETCLKKNRIEEARSAVSDAIGHDANSPRASLIRGQVDINEQLFDDAIKVLQKIRDQDAVYVPESLETLSIAYQGSNQPSDAFRAYLSSCLEVTPSISIVLTIAASIRDELGDEAVAKFVANHLKKNPTIRGLTQLIDLHMDNTEGIAKENLSILRSFTEALVADKPAYRCNHCGFEGKKMRWYCPSCKDWSTIRPIFGLEGE